MAEEPMSADRGAITVGTPVYSRDGETLGTVTEAAAHTFKVNAPRRPDYWLAVGLVEHATAERVVVAFDANQLGHYQLEQPEDALDPRRTHLAGSDLIPPDRRL